METDPSEKQTHAQSILYLNPGVKIVCLYSLLLLYITRDKIYFINAINPDPPHT